MATDSDRPPTRPASLPVVPAARPLSAPPLLPPPPPFVPRVPPTIPAQSDLGVTEIMTSPEFQFVELSPAPDVDDTLLVFPPAEGWAQFNQHGDIALLEHAAMAVYSAELEPPAAPEGHLSLPCLVIATTPTADMLQRGARALQAHRYPNAAQIPALDAAGSAVALAASRDADVVLRAAFAPYDLRYRDTPRVRTPDLAARLAPTPGPLAPAPLTPAPLELVPTLPRPTIAKTPLSGQPPVIPAFVHPHPTQPALTASTSTASRDTTNAAAGLLAHGAGLLVSLGLWSAELAYHGWVLLWLWHWFMQPLGLALVSYPSAVGLVVLAEWIGGAFLLPVLPGAFPPALTRRDSAAHEQDGFPRSLHAMIRRTLAATFALAAGALVHAIQL